MKPTLLLASGSPQRRVLLQGLGLPFEVEVSRVNEEQHPELVPSVRAEALACAKAEEVCKRFPNRWVIGCDTLVEAPDGTLLEKAHDEEEARQMLMLQSGGTSIVHSGLCVIDPNGLVRHSLCSSRVTFRPLHQADLDWWISTNLWKDRSGSFQIDGPGQLMIERVEGDFTGVVGLPVFLLGELLKEAGYPLYD